MAGVEEARDILEALGMPPPQRNEMSGMTLIALCGLTPDAEWSSAERRSCTVTKGIMDYLREHYGADYAPNTRETFRRQVLHQFVQGRIADYNPFEPGLPTNSRAPTTPSPKRPWKPSGVMEGTDGTRPRRSSAANKAPSRNATNASANATWFRSRCPAGASFGSLPAATTRCRRPWSKSSAPRFAPGARLLYLGDTARKDLLVDEAGLAELGIPITDHDKLPDVVLHDAERNWLFLVEAVTSHGPVTPKRVVELEDMLSACPAGAVYVSAFPDFGEFRKHMKAIAWETEVWLCDAPDHMIHYDGDRFLGPRM